MKQSNISIAMCLTLFVAISHVEMAHAQKKTPAVKTTQTKPAVVNTPKSPFYNPLDDDTIRRLDAASARVKERVDDARRLLESGDSEGAKAKAMTAFDVAPVWNGVPRAETAERLLGEIAYAQKNYREALRWFSKYGENTMDERLVYDIALCYVQMRDYGNAKRCYSHDLIYENSSMTVATDLPVVHNLQSLEASILMARGLEYNSIGQHKKAISDYDAASRLAPDNAWVRFRKGESLRFSGRHEDAKVAYREAARLGNVRVTKMAKEYLWQDELTP